MDLILARLIRCRRSDTVPLRVWLRSSEVWMMGVLLVFVSLYVGCDLLALGAPLPLVAGWLMAGPVAALAILFVLAPRAVIGDVLEDSPSAMLVAIQTVYPRLLLRPPNL